MVCFLFVWLFWAEEKSLFLYTVLQCLGHPYVVIRKQTTISPVEISRTHVVVERLEVVLGCAQVAGAFLHVVVDV